MIIFHENNKNIPAKSIWAPWYACCFCTYFLKKEPWEQGKLVSNIFQKMGKNHTTIVTFLYKDISNFAKKERINHESTRKSTSKIIFKKKNDNQCLVICDSINFKKENKITILSWTFLCKISKIWWKKSCYNCVFDIIFLKFFWKKATWE